MMTQSCQRLVGNVGLLLTNRSKKQVLKYVCGRCMIKSYFMADQSVISFNLSHRWFDTFAEDDFARSGTVAAETVVLPAGAMSSLLHHRTVTASP